MKKVILTNGAPQPVGPYSQAIVSQGFVFCSGQVAINLQNNKIGKSSVKEQTTMVLQNISNVLNDSGSNIEHVVKCAIYLTDINNFDEMNSAYKEFFKNDFPARLTVQVANIYGGFDVEIEAIGEIIK